MKKFTAEQRLFLEHMAAGKSVMNAASAIGRSHSAPYGWARRNPVFAEQFAALNPKFRTHLSNTNVDTVAAISSIATISLHQLAMQRLEREIRTDGPHAVMASAAIVLTTPQAMPSDTPVAESDQASDSASGQIQLLAFNHETVSSAMYRMLNEVFPKDAPRTIHADIWAIRAHLEQYFDCNLSEYFGVKALNISNNLKNHAGNMFPVVFSPKRSMHGARIYLIPEPATRA
jgi:hypothetical protein